MSSRPTAVAGLFYPEQPEVLQQMLEQLDEDAYKDNIKELKALVVPHAGYIYSGPIAASAYKTVKSREQPIERIILLGPAHRVAFNGVADSGFESLNTPFGALTVDVEDVNRLVNMKLLKINESAHREEHSLEVQFPFISKYIGHDIPVLSLVSGMQSEPVLLRILQSIWSPGDLIIVSSDLSHFLNYEKALKKDRQTSELICNLKANLDGYQACGCHPLNALMVFAKTKGWQAKCLDLRNSGDTAGDKKRVVGYGAYAFY